jgi:4-amino-4-deoxy-L-arabinose transferase-like glycosyltransferase
VSKSACRARLQSPAPVFALLALWLVATAGLRPLILPDEGRYAGVAFEMFAARTWVPTLNGLPFFHKPPLMYLIDMAAFTSFGVSVFAARVAPMIGAWLMGVTLWLALRRWHDARTAGIGLLVLATSPFYFVGAQFANHDMLVAGLIGAAVLAIVRAVDDGAGVALRWLLAAWALSALAVLAKGLIGIVLPGAIVALWLLAQGRWRDLLRLLHPLGLGVFVSIALPWFLAMQHAYPQFFDYFVLDQHVRRFREASFNNAQPLWFYLAVLPIFMLPWTLWLVPAVRRAWAAPRGAEGARSLLWLVWLVVIVGFFSLPTSKLVGYVLPALAPWCALLAPSVAAARTWRWAAALAALGCLGLIGAIASQAPGSHRDVALALAGKIQPGDRVTMVDELFYDIPFYARLTQPAIVASDWNDPQVPLRDNWRKELYDAGRFAPGRARELLWPIDRLAALTCGPGALWLISGAARVDAVRAVPGAERVFAGKHAELWRAPARDCR